MAFRGFQHMLCSSKKPRENKKLQVIDKTKDLITSQVRLRKNLYTHIATSIGQLFGDSSTKCSSRVIPSTAIEKFTHQYQYNATCGSFLELLFFQRFWIKLSKYVPSSILPCTLTAIGLLVNMASFILLVIHAPQIPDWVSVIGAICLFLYQTLDALDGKQATKLQNTHLEELADHGSDSLSTSLIALSVALSMRLRPSWTFALWFVSLLAFFSVHWQTHVSNVVVFGYIDVTEVQVSMIAIHLLTATLGQEFWTSTLPFTGLEIRQLVVVVSISCMTIAIFSNLFLVFSGRQPLDSVAAIPRRKGISVLYPIIPLIIWIILCILTIPLYFDISPALLCLFDGLIFTKLLINLQVATMGSTSCPSADSMFAAPVLLIINEVIDWMPTKTAFTCGLVYVITDLRFVTYLAWDICDLQEIYIFSLKYPVGHPKNRSGNHGVYLNGLNNAEILESKKRTIPSHL